MRDSGKLALAALALVALVLGGCGRRGALDFPPQAATPAAAAGQAAQPASAANSPVGIFDATDDDQQQPQAPQGRKRRIILDRLLD